MTMRLFWYCGSNEFLMILAPVGQFGQRWPVYSSRSVFLIPTTSELLFVMNLDPVTPFLTTMGRFTLSQPPIRTHRNMSQEARFINANLRILKTAGDRYGDSV